MSDARPPHRGPGQAGPHALPLAEPQRRQPLPVRPRCARVPLVQAPADEAPVHYCAESFIWALLVGHPLRRHHDHGHLPRGVLLEPTIVIRDPLEDFPLPMNIAHGPRQARRSSSKVAASVAGLQNSGNF